MLDPDFQGIPIFRLFSLYYMLALTDVIFSIVTV